MDWQAWGKALELYVNTPELIYASIFAAIAIFGFAYPRVAMMQSGQDWYGDDGPRSLDGPS
jgi:hypothetical protein